jgi:hypothetical protein
MTQYPWHVRTGAALSQLLNAMFFVGHPNETLSARAWREHETSRFWSLMRVLADALFGLNHCEQSIQEDRQFAKDILNCSE